MPDKFHNPQTARIIVFSSLFPSEKSPTSGTFIKERMFRVAERLPLVVVAPQAWSPFDWMLRLYRRSFRPMSKEYEVVDGIEVYRPKVLSIPIVLKRLDGFFMAHGSKTIMDELVAKFRPTIIDAHFGYPDGYAASKHAKRLGLPLTITLRGSKDEWLIGTDREPALRSALGSATQLFSVSESLKQDVAVKLLGNSARCDVVGNGVNLDKFFQLSKSEARKHIGVPENSKIIISVGSLIDRKGFHRIIPIVKSLKQTYPNLIYLIVGGGTTHGDLTGALKRLASDHGVADSVRFCGAQLPEELRWFYSASDVFALATEHEGWANVFLEAMACGLPVVSTLVGGNSQVVCNKKLGLLTPFWDSALFEEALDLSLRTDWNRESIIEYAQANSWNERIDRLVATFNRIAPVKDSATA